MLEHFNKEDQEFVKRIRNLEGKNYLTKFLDINQQSIVGKIIPNAIFYGGYEKSELKRASSIGCDDFKITCFKIEYDRRYGKLNHRNILGSVLSLGIEKDNIGDIIIGDDIHIFVASEIERYIELNFIVVGKINITLIKVDGSNLLRNDDYKVIKVILRSFRLDNIISSVYNCSRNESKKLINKGFVRVNHKLIESVSYIVKKDDLISVRKKGRFIFLEEMGMTRKSNYFISVGLY
ncbi:YlmH/Sll1252 family protein [Mycoplasmatota bacterium zrk1]